MTIHILLLAVICFLGLGFYCKGTSIEKNKKFVVISMFFVFLVEALRAPSVGADTANYVRGFNILSNRLENVYYSWTVYGWEPLWRALNYAVGIFTKNSQWFLAVTSLIIVIGIGRFVYLNCADDESAFWPIFFFITLAILYPSSMNLLRQFVALGFLLEIYTLSKRKNVKKRLLKSIILLAIAVGFHKSAILGVMIIWHSILRNQRNDNPKKQIFIAIAISILMPFLFPLALRVFITVFPEYTIYLNTVWLQGESLRMYSVVMTLFRIIIIVVVVLFLDPKSESNEEVYQLCIYNAYAIGFMVLQTQILMAQRFGYYFETFLILLIPKVVRKLKYSQLFFLAMLVLAWAFFLFELSTGARQTVPYSFFWQYYS